MTNFQEVMLFRNIVFKSETDLNIDFEEIKSILKKEIKNTNKAKNKKRKGVLPEVGSFHDVKF